MVLLSRVFITCIKTFVVRWLCVWLCSWLFGEFVRWCGLEMWLGEAEVVVAPLPPWECKLCRLNNEGGNGGRAEMVVVCGVLLGVLTCSCAAECVENVAGGSGSGGVLPAILPMEAVYDSPTSAKE